MDLSLVASMSLKEISISEMNSFVNEILNLLDRDSVRIIDINFDNNIATVSVDVSTDSN